MSWTQCSLGDSLRTPGQGSGVVDVDGMERRERPPQVSDLPVDRGHVFAPGGELRRLRLEQDARREPLDRFHAISEAGIDALAQLRLVVGEVGSIPALDSRVRVHLDAASEGHPGENRLVPELLELLEVTVRSPPPLIEVEAQYLGLGELHVSAEELARGREHIDEVVGIGIDGRELPPLRSEREERLLGVGLVSQVIAPERRMAFQSRDGRGNRIADHGFQAVLRKEVDRGFVSVDDGEACLRESDGLRFPIGDLGEPPEVDQELERLTSGEERAQ